MGMDMGTSAIKMVVLDSQNRSVYSRYRRHLGDPDACLGDLLSEAAVYFPMARVGGTGSLSGSLASLGVFILDAVPATVEGCLATAPESGCIMEIGAARSRFITGFSKGDTSRVKFFFNSSCSAGTGSFLEEQARRLNIPLEALSDQTRLARKALPIAGRCSVFSKTDMIHFQQEGAAIPDILLGLIHAMVRNYKANVVQRHPVRPPVFLTGRVMEIHGIRRALAKTFGLAPGDFILEPDNSYINAMGAALAIPGDAPVTNLSHLHPRLGSMVPGPSPIGFAPALAPFGRGEQRDLHPRKESRGPVTGHLGVDVGSTSTNLVVISPDREVLDWQYLRTRGTPLETVETGIKQLKQRLGKEMNILSTGVTGSGRYLAGKSLGADLVINEITAQAEGTLFHHPEADTILEIGGQDSKFIRLENQVVTDFEMNRICAAGTGSFLEEQAAKIGVEIRDFGGLALGARAPLDLGDRCTVFIEGALSKALAQGEDKADIVAGLAYSIVRNYLTRVAGERPLGKQIFLQGGIAHNQGVVNAFRSLLGQPVTVTPYFSVTGALGAALLARSRHLSNRNSLHESPDSTAPVPDIWAQSQALFLEGYKPGRFPGHPTIGIPRVLFLHKLFVLFNRFFTELGFNVLISEPTTREMVDKSRENALEETCYPVKLVNGHVDALIRQGVNYIFLPTVFTMKHADSRVRKDYGCVYMQTTAQLTAHAMDLEGRGISLLSPKISFKFGTRYIAKTILDLGKKLGKSKFATIVAMQKAALGFMKYNRDLARLGNGFLSSLPQNTPVFVIITRPYGINDPVLNMAVPKHLASMGYKVMPLSVLNVEDVDLNKSYPNMYWPFGQHILAGARKIRRTPNLYAVYLTNHGCGPDTALLHLFRREMRGKPFLHLEVDEHSSKVGVITRLEAFAMSFDKKPVPPTAPPGSTGISSPLNKNLPLYIPSLFPYSDLARTVLENRGFNARVLPPTDQDSLKKGRALGAAKEYLSFVSLMGDAKKQARTAKPGQILIPQTEGSEVEGLYAQVISTLLRDSFPQTRIYSPFLEDAITAPDFFPGFFLPLVAGDLILSAPPENRKEHLAKLLASPQVLTPDAVIALASRIASPPAPGALNLLMIGEPAVVFNPFNHRFLIEDIKARVCYQPLSEILYLFWEDWNHRKQDPMIRRNLNRCRQLMIQVARALGESSSFEPDPNALKPAADKRLTLFSGSNGRYRLAKRFTQTTAHGILDLSSAYENTGIITRQIEGSKPGDIPVINLVFDGSAHNGNRELLRNFIYYLERTPDNQKV